MLFRSLGAFIEGPAVPVYSTAREPCSLPRTGQGITAIPAPRVSEKIQAEEEGHKGGQQDPWLEVEDGGR